MLRFHPILALAAGLMISSLSGLAQVWREEMPGPIGAWVIEGKFALIVGWMEAITCWIGAAVFVILAYSL